MLKKTIIISEKQHDILYDIKRKFKYKNMSVVIDDLIKNYNPKKKNNPK